MPIPPLPLVEKAAGLSIEETLPRVLAGTVDLDTMLEFCTAYRRIGICQLLMSGLPDEFFAQLSRSARAFLFYLQHAPEAATLTSTSEPFFDAMACGDLNAVRAIMSSSRRTWNPDAEYEDDFLYVDILMDLLATPATTGPRLEVSLARYAALVGGQEDLHLELCRALLARSTHEFEEKLGAYVEQKYQQYRRKLSQGRLHPDDAATTEQVCIEGIGLVWLARQLGMSPSPGALLMPSPALLFSRARLPAPDAWKHIHSYRELA